MKRLSILCMLSALTLSFQTDHSLQPDRTEAIKAYQLLNTIRVNSSNYYKEFDFLRTLQFKKSNLIWNDTLARVAETKAMDMASRSYFGHVNPDGYGMNYYINKSGYRLLPEWLKSKELNYFESLSAGSKDGEASIKYLLWDVGIPSLGHRYHLLGVGEWNHNLKDIGIGFVRCDSCHPYKTFMCVLIAKHDW